MAAVVVLIPRPWNRASRRLELSRFGEASALLMLGSSSGSKKKLQCVSRTL